MSLIGDLRLHFLTFFLGFLCLLFLLFALCLVLLGLLASSLLIRRLLLLGWHVDTVLLLLGLSGLLLGAIHHFFKVSRELYMRELLGPVAALLLGKTLGQVGTGVDAYCFPVDVGERWQEGKQLRSELELELPRGATGLTLGRSGNLVAI